MNLQDYFKSSVWESFVANQGLTGSFVATAVTAMLLAVITMVIMLFVVHIFYKRRKQGAIYILVVHYEGETAGDEIMRSLKKMKFQLKSKTLRAGAAEMTMEVRCNTGNTVFLEHIQKIEGVQDVTFIQYNGEYHG